MRAGWVVVVPVRDAAAGKTRLSGALDPRTRAELVRAMALDTVAAAVSCPVVRRVVVVTPDDDIARAAVGLGAIVEPEPEPEAELAWEPEREHAPESERERWQGAPGERRGAPSSRPRSALDAAALTGVLAARELVPGAPVAVLLGDLPTLRADDLGAALDAAAAHNRALVVDAAGTGTTLLAVRATVPFVSRFGAGSAAAHRDLGYVNLDVPEASTLCHDVDLPGDLAALRRRDPGPRTARVLARLG